MLKYKRVLLVSPLFNKGRNRLALLPLAGLAYIAEALERAGINVNVLDMNLGYSFHDLEFRIIRFKPDLIGITAMTLGYWYFYNMIDRLKKKYPQIKIAIGGAHASALKEKALEECPSIDYGFILESDINMVQLCCGEELSNIQGFIYRDNGKITTNKFEYFIENLDSLPFPKYKSFELDKYPTRQLGIVTSRGCPYDCIYCSVISTIGKKFRARSAQSIVNEIEYWHNQGYRQIFILDDNFTLLRNRVEDICASLIKKGLRGLHLKLPNGIRADRVDRSLLELMKNAGFDFISFGVESGSNKVLKNLKKGENIEKIEQSIKDACDLGFDVDLFFIIGSPGETLEDVEMSFSLANRYPLRRAIFYNLVPLPGTELLKFLISNGYLLYPIDKILNEASYYLNRPFFFTPEMSVRDKEKALEMGRKITLQIRRKYIERKINAPLVLKRIFSYLYTLPLADDLIVNNRFIVQVKEKIKEALL